MQVKKNGAFLLGGVAMVAVMGNMQESKSAEVAQKLRVNVCDSISNPNVLPSFLHVEWSKNEEMGGVLLKGIKVDEPEEVPFIRLEAPISNSVFKKDSEISTAQPQIVITKDKKEKVNAATVEVQQIKHQKHWYAPMVKFCSWVKRTVLSWFGR